MRKFSSEKLKVLHVLHSWGGGLERWVNDFCLFDNNSISYQLRSVGEPSIPGKKLELSKFSSSRKSTYLDVFHLSSPITSTSIYDIEYRSYLEEIIAKYEIDVLIISSFIGHSLELLSLEKALKIVVCHDYYPFCPAINIYFKDVCTNCSYQDLKECFKSNAYNRFFPFAEHQDWPSIRESYLELILIGNIPLVIPSPSVKKHLKQLAPSLEQANFFLIPHGLDNEPFLSLPWDEHREPSSSKQQSIELHKKPRVVILGSLAMHKGLTLFEEIHEELSKIAEIYLIGSGKEGARFSRKQGFTYVSKYTNDELPKIIRDISPDLALLLSIWPETYSYTLSELFLTQTPVLATALGSFEDRINDAVNGFLVEPFADKILEKVNYLLNVDKPRNALNSVIQHLRYQENRNVKTMIEDYHRLISILQKEYISVLLSQEKKESLEEQPKFNVNFLFQENIYYFREAILQTRQLKLDLRKISNPLKSTCHNVDKAFSFVPQSFIYRRVTKRIPLTAKFPILKSLKKRFPQVWENVRLKLLELGVLS